MKLYKLENNYEVWYFSTKAKLARFLNIAPQRIEGTLRRGTNHIGDWNIEIIEDDHIISKFIDPESPCETEQIVLLGKLNEAIKILLRNDKRINELEKRIEELNKNIN